MRDIDKLINIEAFHQPGYHCIKLSDFQQKAVSEFNKKILAKKLLYENVLCLCGKDKFSLVAGIDRYGFIQSTVMCKNCGLIQSNPRLTPEYYCNFYESDSYRRLYDGEDFVRDYELIYKDGRSEVIYQTIIKYKDLNEIKSVLEFGAGGGWNLVPFVKKGISVVGYDFSNELVILGKKKGINLVKGSLKDIQGQHDVIIVNHVIEHFTDFLNDIKKLKLHLNKNGIMYVAVPDIYQFSMEQLQNAHIYYFTQKTFQYYMGKCGLRMIHCQPEHGGHMSGIFILGDPVIEDSFLEGHYNEMVRMLRKYSQLYGVKRFGRKFLEKVGLKRNRISK